jgi:hypothetical protein
MTVFVQSEISLQYLCIIFFVLSSDLYTDYQSKYSCGESPIKSFPVCQMVVGSRGRT